MEIIIAKRMQSIVQIGLMGVELWPKYVLTFWLKFGLKLLLTPPILGVRNLGDDAKDELRIEDFMNHFVVHPQRSWS